MCYTLDADKIIFNYFKICSNRDTLSFVEFNHLSTKIVIGCNNGIIARTHKLSVENAVDRSPKVFHLSDNKREIRVLDRSYIDSNITRINKNIPPSVLNAIERIIGQL